MFHSQFFFKLYTCAVCLRKAFRCRMGSGEAGAYHSPWLQWWSLGHTLHSNRVWLHSWRPLHTWYILFDIFTPLRPVSCLSPPHVLHSITITKCDFPEPIVEFNPNNTGFTTSISGLSVALTGGWMTHFGLMWVSVASILEEVPGSFNWVHISILHCRTLKSCIQNLKLKCTQILAKYI